ncbi:MAG: PAS domain S-box protein [Candidatus Viridilinea halotolerans]|uniref:PAS domain S-box protein n=1 Tax=Candidatus Viridilinea halotolerans TaxID=2491704 RepID=A0A426U2U1_9CHLR|nr:MAG: PAS domain S-box protein [Candidatus Viridilinea halotolerans]
MSTHINLVILEDRDADALRIIHALRQAGFDPVWRQVSTEHEYRAALETPPELILADYTLIQFGALRALDILLELKLDIPFIIVSETIGEETAVAALQRGATDYLLKDHLTRLGMTVQNAIQRQQLRREQQLALTRLSISESRFRALIEHSADGVTLVDSYGIIQYVSPATERILGFSLGTFTGAEAISFVHPRDRENVCDLVKRLAPDAGVASIELRVRHQDGTWRWIEAFFSNMLDDAAVAAIVVNYRDISTRVATADEMRLFTDELVNLHHLERRARLHAETLRSANLNLTRSLELDHVLESLFTALMRLVPNTHTQLVLINEGTPSAAYALVPSQSATITSISLDDVDLEASPLAQTILQTGEGCISEDETHIGVPMQAHGNLIGLCLITSYADVKLSSDHLRWVEAVVAQASIAMQNARLFDEVQYARQRLQTLSRKLIQAQENERRHLARELHDEIGQVLIALQMNLRGVGQGQLDAKQQARLMDSSTLVERLIQQVRSLSRELRPPLLDDLGLVPALNWHLDQISSRFAIDIKMTTQLQITRIPAQIELSIFRIVQEALNNVIKHAKADRVRVELRQSEQKLRLIVSDNGIGFETDSAQQRAANGASLGLINMQERALLVNGQFEIISAPEAGTCVCASFGLDGKTR